MADPELERAATTAAGGGLGMALVLVLKSLADKWRPSNGLVARLGRLEDRFAERVEKALASHADAIAALRAEDIANIRDRMMRAETILERLEAAIERLEGESRQ